MLTYSLSLKDRYIPPLTKIISAQIVESLWNTTFRPEELCPHNERYWEDPLTTHRVKIIRASNVFVEENNLPTVFKTVLEESVFSLYHAYSRMLQWKTVYDPNGGIKLLGEDEFYAPNYFTVDGEFDHLAWTKRVVLDPNHPVTSRFYLACLYWLEIETAMLWSEMKKSDLIPFNGNMGDIVNEMDPLITLRIFQMEDKLEDLSLDQRYAGEFYEVGLKIAAVKRYEYATYFFWQNIDGQDKINITSNDDYFYLMSSVVDPYDKVCNFLYSQLSKKRKEKFIDWSIVHDRPNGWINLLLSPSTRTERSEIIQFVYQLSIKLYSNILGFIATRIMDERIPFDSEMFEILWKYLSLETKDELLEMTPSIFDMLVAAEFEDTYSENLKNIVDSLTVEQYEKYFECCLVHP